MVTIKDVAKEAGVSIATVSNYINRKKKISLETGERIEKAINSLNYVVQSSGRDLRLKKNNDIGIIFPNISDPYLEKVISSIKGYLSQYDQNFVLELTDNNPNKETKSILNFLGRKVAGIILYSCQPSNQEIFVKLEKSGIPYVLIDRRPEHAEYNFVGIDHKTLFHQLAKDLAQRGFLHQALVCGPLEYTENADARSGFVKALANQNTERPAPVISTTALRECGFRAGMQLLEKEQSIPDIILTSSYHLAEGIRYAMKVCHVDQVCKTHIISTGDAVDDVFYHDDTILKTSRPAYLVGEETGKLLLKNIRSPIVFEKEQIILHDSYAKTMLPSPGAYHTAAFKQDSLHIQSASIADPTLISSSEEDHIRILLLDDNSSNTALSRLLVDFYAQEHIAVSIEKVLPEEAFEFLCTYFRSGRDDIDVVLFDLPWLPYFADHDYLICMDELIDNLSLDDGYYLPKTLEYYSLYRGHHYALPYMACTQLLFYRKDLFEDEALARQLDEDYMVSLHVPQTWFQFNTLARFFTRTCNPRSPVPYGHSMSIFYPEQLICSLMPRIWDYKGDLGSIKDAISFDTTSVRKGIRSFLESIPYATPDYLSSRPIDNVNQFIAGETAMLYTYYNYATGIVDRLRSNVVNNFGYARLPGKPVLCGWCLGIPTNSRHVESAFRFIKWASGPDIAIPHTILGGQSPNLSVYRNYDMVSLYPWLPKAHQELNKAAERIPVIRSHGHVISEKSIEDIIYQQMLPLIMDAKEGNIADLSRIKEVTGQIQRMIAGLRE